MKRIVIVTGPPCGGKTTYVNQNAGPRDVVFDYDAIKSAVCMCDPHEDRPYAWKLISSIRNAFIEYVLQDPTDEIETVYYVECRAQSQWLDRLRRATRAYIQVVNCEATLEECLTRLEKDETRTDRNYQRKLIYQYFR